MSVFPPFRRGKCCPFFFFFSVSGLVSFAVFCRSSFLRVAFWKNFRERTFVFGWLCWSCVFWWVFAIVFVLFFGVSLPKLFGKILLMSGLVFSGFVLSSLGFAPTSFLFLFVFSFERQRSGSNRTPPHTHLFFWFFFFFVSRRFLSVPPVLAVRPASWRFSGVPFWAPGGFGILLELMGLELVRSPFPRPFSWDARRQGFSCASSALFFFSPFRFAATLCLEKRSR